MLFDILIADTSRLIFPKNPISVKSIKQGSIVGQ
jgi:hypothetical protein